MYIQLVNMKVRLVLFVFLSLASVCTFLSISGRKGKEIMSSETYNHQFYDIVTVTEGDAYMSQLQAQTSHYEAQVGELTVLGFNSSAECRGLDMMPKHLNCSDELKAELFPAIFKPVSSQPAATVTGIAYQVSESELMRAFWEHEVLPKYGILLYNVTHPQQLSTDYQIQSAKLCGSPCAVVRNTFDIQGDQRWAPSSSCCTQELLCSTEALTVVFEHPSICSSDQVICNGASKALYFHAEAKQVYIFPIPTLRKFVCPPIFTLQSTRFAVQNNDALSKLASFNAKKHSSLLPAEAYQMILQDKMLSDARIRSLEVQVAYLLTQMSILQQTKPPARNLSLEMDSDQERRRKNPGNDKHYCDGSSKAGNLTLRLSSVSCSTCLEVTKVMLSQMQNTAPVEYSKIFCKGTRPANIKRSLCASSTSRCKCIVGNSPIYICEDCNKLTLWDHELGKRKEFSSADFLELASGHTGYQCRMNVKRFATENVATTTGMKDSDHAISAPEKVATTTAIKDSDHASSAFAVTSNDSFAYDIVDDFDISNVTLDESFWYLK